MVQWLVLTLIRIIWATWTMGIKRTVDIKEKIKKYDRRLHFWHSSVKSTIMQLKCEAKYISVL